MCGPGVEILGRAVIVGPVLVAAGGVAGRRRRQRGRLDNGPADPFAAVSNCPADQAMALQAAQVPIDAGIAVSGAAVGDNVPVRMAFNDFDSRTESLRSHS